MQLYLYMFVRSVSSRPGMQNALRIGLVPEQTTSGTPLSAAPGTLLSAAPGTPLSAAPGTRLSAAPGTRLSAALPFFPDAPDYFSSYDVLQLMLTDTTCLHLYMHNSCLFHLNF